MQQQRRGGLGGLLGRVPMPVVAAGLLAFVYTGLHTVDEGNAGVYWIGGALRDKVSGPGWNVKIPFIETMAQVQVTMQTDSVTNIPCGTSGGVLVTFARIEVVNRLSKDHVVDTVRKYGVNYDQTWIFDKIHHEINQFCSAHTVQEVYIDLFDTLDESLAKALQADCTKYDTGIEIIAVRVTKPDIPHQLRMNYERVEDEKTQLLIAAQAQKVEMKKEETARLKLVAEAQKEKEVREVQIQKEILEKEGAQKMKMIEDQMWKASEQAKSDAITYASKAAADAYEYDAALPRKA